MVSSNGKGRNEGKPLQGRTVTGKCHFPIGVVTGRGNVVDIMARHKLHPIILAAMHASGVWGEVSPIEALANEVAVAEGKGMVRSIFRYGSDEIWVITKLEDEQTILLDPNE